MSRSKLFLLMTALLCLLLMVNIAAAQDATEEAGESTPVSPIPGAECDTETAPSGDPIRVGGTLALTGPFAPTANVHRIVGEIYVDMLNECGGLLGRPVEWVLEDDQGAPDQAAAIYERLITVDNVDLLIGPYAAANILAVAAVVDRYDRIYITHTNGRPDIEITDYHFPAWQVVLESAEANPWGRIGGLLWDTLLSSENPPSNVLYITNKFPTTAQITLGARENGEARDLQTLDYIEYDTGTTDFSAIATRIVAADPDFIFLGAIGIDANNLYDALDTLGYAPRGIFIALPAPGPLLAMGERVNNVLTYSIYEEQPPFTDSAVAQEFIARYRAAATEAGLFPIVETQAAASFVAWQILTEAVTETESLDNTELRDWLEANPVDSIAGEISFDGFNHFGTDFNRLVQIQDGVRVIVAPEEFKTPDVSLVYPSE